MNDRNLQIEDLYFHVHRIYIYGTNRYDNRWFLKSEPPEEIVYLVSIKHYRIFVQVTNNFFFLHKFNRNLIKLFLGTGQQLFS